MMLTKNDIGKYYIVIASFTNARIIGQLTSVGKGTCKYRFKDVEDDTPFDLYWDFSVIREIHESELLAKIM